MKILVVQESDWLLRGPHQQHHLMERLALKGHEIHVIDYEILWKEDEDRGLLSRKQVFDNISRFYEGANVTVIRPGIVKIPYLDQFSLFLSHREEIKKQIDVFKPEVIVGFGILNTYLAMRLAKRNGIPFIYYLIDTLHRLVSPKPLQWIAKEFEKKTLKDANQVIVINEALKEYAVRLGADSESTVVLGAGIDTRRFNPNIDGARIRKKYGISPNDVVLFFMGWLYEFSGLREVALGLAELQNKYPFIKLLIVGEGDLLDELKSIRDKYKCGKNILLTGKQPYKNIPKYLAVSNICLLPAHNNEIMKDIVPIKMYEYMACGKPVVSTRLPGVMREFGYNNGVIYVNQPKDTLEKALMLSKEKVNLIKHGEKARKHVEKYSWDRITDKFEEVLKAIVD